MKFFITSSLLLVALTVNSQQLSQVTFSFDGRLLNFAISTQDGLLIRVSPEGQLMEYGTEEAALNNSNYYAPNLRPYLGRVDNYGNEADEAIAGKVKGIGFASITWYAHYEVAIKVGRLKSIGNIMFDYYDNFSEQTLQGKIKNIGNLTLEYNSAISGDEGSRGKLRSVGNMPITYFSSFDDRQVRGKIKSIGSVSYDWYTSFDINRSGLKSGLYRREINGVTYIIR